MKRQEYIFTIGFSGNTAIVDGNGLARYGSLSTAGLLEAGLFKQALASAWFEQDEQGQAQVLEAYNRTAGTSFERPAQLRRVFGLTELPDDADKVRVLK